MNIEYSIKLFVLAIFILFLGVLAWAGLLPAFSAWLRDLFVTDLVGR